MILKVINSNSKGNAYLLGNGQSALLIECGVSYNDIMKAADHNIMQIDLCIITHEHMDHCKAYRGIQQSGIPIVASRGTYNALRVSREQMDVVMSNGSKYSSPKGWRVTSFKVDHDAAEPLGYVIEHDQTGRILFVTDTYILRYKFPYKFDHILIEANYCADTRDKVASKKGDKFVEGRRLKNHMSFQTAMHTLSKMDLSECKNIVLTHLSDGLTDEKRFKEDTEKQFGIPTTVAGPGVNINFGLNPF